MKLSFTYKGRKYKNGFACDGYGVPITTNSGYSSQDEHEARESYEETLKEMQSEKKSNPKNAQPFVTETKIKFSHKTKLYPDKRFLTNDIGEEISVENGYTDVDEAEGIKIKSGM